MSGSVRSSSPSTGTIAHCQQNDNYVTPAEHYVYVHHVECLRDGGILDPDDHLFDVFDENKDQILAIYDEPDDAARAAAPDSTQAYAASRFAISGTTSSSSTSSSSTTAKSVTSVESRLEGKLNIISTSNDGDVVEITNIAEPPTDGLRVVSDNTHTLQQMPTSSLIITGSETAFQTPPHQHFEQKRVGGVLNTNRIYHSALRNIDGSPRNKHRVTISPDADGQTFVEESSASAKETVMTRTSARKSRLTDSFFDAKERLEERLARSEENQIAKSDGKMSKLIPVMEATNRAQTVVVLSDSTINMPLGIEISPVCDPANSTRLHAVEIRQVDDEGRIGLDGRLRIGDHIVEINQRPVYQMSISRARAYLHEIQMVSHPSLTIDRPIDTFASDAVSHRSQSSTSSLQKRPILSALQQANTTALGATFPVEIVKRSGGFGFTVTSRETAKGERLFYIGTVRADGAATNKLKAGDRLLMIGSEKTADLSQNDLVERLKRLNIGDSVKLLVSRLGGQENENQVSGASRNVQEGQESDHRESVNEEVERCSGKPNQSSKDEILTLSIMLNETGSAGLGVSLKARAVMKSDGTRQDCGIFIKKVLHGGAAYKDGRLQVNDQLIVIEDIDLRSMKNSEASDAITRCLKDIGPNATSVRLCVLRNLELLHDNNSSSIRSSVDESLILNRSSFMVRDGSRAQKRDSSDAVIVKQHNPNNGRNDVGTRRRISSLGDRSLINEDLDSFASDRQKCLSEDEVSHVDVDAFSRENPARRSISEKRHMGPGNDASNTMLFQKLKHSRQTSAPALQCFVPFVSPPLHSAVMSSSRSATSLREKCRRRSLALLRSSGGKAKSLIGMSAESGEKIAATGPSIGGVSSPSKQELGEADLPSSPNRRSLSLESMEANRLPTPAASAHPSEPALRDAVRVEQAARRVHPNALKRAQKSRPNGQAQPSLSDVEDRATAEAAATEKGLHEPYASLPRDVAASSKEKQQRRKSVGSSLFSKISQRLGGSRSREASPEKSVTFDVAGRSPVDGIQNRVQNNRDWNKQSVNHHVQRKPPPPYKPPSCDIRQAKKSGYYENDMPGTHNTETVCSGEEIPAGGYIRVANSKFYNSFVERSSRDHPKVECATGNDVLQSTTKKAAPAEDETHLLVPTKQQQNTAGMSSICDGNNPSSSDKQHCGGNTTRGDRSMGSTRDAAATTTMPSMPGLHTAQRHQTEIYRSIQEDEVAATRLRVFTFPQQQRRQIDQQQQYSKSIMKDSGRVQVSCPQQQQHYERGGASKELVRTTQPAMLPVPVVFPTSRTFFVAPSSRMSGRRTNSSQGGARSSLRNRAKSVSSRPSKESSSLESSAKQPKNLPQTAMSSCELFLQNQQNFHRSSNFRETPIGSHQQLQEQSSGAPEIYATSPPVFKTSTPPAPYIPSDFNEATLSRPDYLQTLLESPVKSATDADVAKAPGPIKYIKIHYGSSNQVVSKQQPLRTRSVDFPSPGSADLFRLQQQQEIMADFDYQKYLRATCPDRGNSKGQRVTLIATVPNETTLLRRGAQLRRPNTLYSS